MISIHKTLLVLLLTCTITILMGQYTITGTISDEQGPLPFSNIQLLDTDSTMIRGELSDDMGAFSIESDAGTYLLKISYLGYGDHLQTIDVSADVNLGTIIIAEQTAELAEITITAQKRLIERRPDRLVFNMSNSIAAQGTDLADAIQLAPGLRLDNNTLSMVGRGAVRVMVNGRMIQLEGEDLIAYLAGISSDDIDKIEVISNPPAKYDAAGNSGLINIIYKKGRRNSWKNNASVSLTQARERWGSLRNGLQYNKGNHSLSISANASLGKNWNREYGAILFPTETQEWDSKYIGDRASYGGRLAYDYALSDQTSIGAQYQGSYSMPDVVGNTLTDVKAPAGTVKNVIENVTEDERTRSNHVANAHLVIDLDTMGTRLSIDADYFSYDQGSSTDLNIGETMVNGPTRSRLINADQSIQNYSLKLDMEHPTSLADLSYGAKYNRNISDNEIQNFDRLGGTQVLDQTLSNTFEYTEDIYATYLSGSRSLSDQWSMQLGARVEHTTSEGYSQTLDQTNTNKYTRVFPTAYLNYTPNADHQLSVSVGGRINRANFRDLNPFRIYITNTNYSEGNPFLRPSYTNTYDVNYVYKGIFTTSVFLRHHKNDFGTLFVPSIEMPALATIRENYNDRIDAGISESFPITITKNWSTQNQVYLLYSHTSIDSPHDVTPQNGWMYYLSSNHTISLGKGMQCQLNMWYNSLGNSNIYKVNARGRVDIGLRKKLLDDQLSINLLVSDVFNSSNLSDLSSTINGVTNLYGQDYSSRNVRLTLSYSFGNDKINVRQRDFGNEETRRRS